MFNINTLVFVREVFVQLQRIKMNMKNVRTCTNVENTIGSCISA